MLKINKSSSMKRANANRTMPNICGRDNMVTEMAAAGLLMLFSEAESLVQSRGS